jgi:hypothetical protein
MVAVVIRNATAKIVKVIQEKEDFPAKSSNRDQENYSSW